MSVREAFVACPERSSAALATGSRTPRRRPRWSCKIIAPAAPGGGWDQTARSLQQAMTAEKLVKSAQVINIPGAGGTVGLAQFVNNKGDGNTLMVNGFVMVGAILLNKSPVNLDQVTPIARLTEETQVIVVPANSPIKDAQGSGRRGEEGRRAASPSPAARPAAPTTSWPACSSARPAATLRRSTTCRSPAAASRSPRSWAAA